MPTAPDFSAPNGPGAQHTTGSAAYRTMAFFATSPDAASTGLLTIDFENQAIQWQSDDPFVGAVRSDAIASTTWSYTDRLADNPARLVLAGRHGDATILGSVRLGYDDRGLLFVIRDDRHVAYSLSTVDLDVDTNRDGIIENYDDEDGEDDWDSTRGALFSVNFDRDGQRWADGMPIPDAIHFDGFGTPVEEDFHIENAADELDITPVVIRKIADTIPDGYSVVLRAAELEDVRRIHVYKHISSEPSNAAIWGSATGEAPPLEIDITDWVNPTSPRFQGDRVTGASTFGIEGLFFRYVGEDVAEKHHFDGYVDLSLELRKDTTVVVADSIRLKVAPWIMLSRDQASQEIWTAAIGMQGLIQYSPGVVDGETFTISDGSMETTFEFNTDTVRDVAPGHVAVDVSTSDSLRDLGDSIAAAINGVDGFAVVASVPAPDVMGGADASNPGIVKLYNTDVTVRGDQATPPAETVADPRFRIVGMSGQSTNATFLRGDLADEGYFGLDATGQLREVIGPDSENQWFQDHVEIGYTQRPGGPKTHVVFRLPYWRGTGGDNPTWPLTRLLGPDVGVFQLGVSLGGGSGDYGGNLEVLPPNSTHPLGTIVMGNRASAKMKQFLLSQEVQYPGFDLPVQWLQLGHIDEVVSLLARGQVAIADPTMAWELLEQIPPEARGRSVFFATGAMPESGSVIADSVMPNRIETGIDLRGQPWRFLRIYDGAARGTMAEIDALADGYITVKRVWRTGSKIVDGTATDRDINYWRKVTPRPAADWEDTPPQAGDKFVLVEDSQLWQNGMPAVVTVAEVLADRDFEALNKIDVQNVLDEIRGKLASQAPSDEISFIEVPSLFFGSRGGARGTGFLAGRSAEAFHPGPANLQEVDGTLYVGRQFGPRDASRNDIFEQAITAALESLPTPLDSPGPRGDQTATNLTGGTNGSALPTAGPDKTAVDARDQSLSNDEKNTSVVDAAFASNEPPAATTSRVRFIDDWTFYHALIGNIHCGTVVKREPLELDWWSA